MSEILLRKYQEEALGTLKTYEACCERSDSSWGEWRPRVLCVMPTGSGKSYLIGAFCQYVTKKLGLRALVVTHRAELIRQDARAIQAMSGIEPTIYCAKLKSKDASGQIVVASINSIFRKPWVMGTKDEVGEVVVIIDECHLISSRKMSMYQKLFECYSGPRVGFTATPYRVDNGHLVDGEEELFEEISYEISSKELIPEYLSPLVGVKALKEIDISGVHRRMGEFVQVELEGACLGSGVCEAIAREISHLADGRRRILIFCTGVLHARRQAQALAVYMPTASLVGEDDWEARSAVLEGFKNGEIRAVTNVNCLTTGYDEPGVDCIVHLRPTLSKGLYTQIQGRGMRKSEGKQDCLVLDFSGNISRHGALDDFSEFRDLKGEEMRAREKAREEAGATAREARQKRDEFMLRIDNLSSLDPMNPEPAGVLEVMVERMTYRLALSAKLEGVTSLVAMYHCEGLGIVSQWVCVEYDGWARRFAEQWFRRRGLRCPRLATEALQLARTAGYPGSVTIRRNGRYWNVTVEHFSSAVASPPDSPMRRYSEAPADDVPF